MSNTLGASTTRQSGRATDDKLLKHHGAAAPIMAMDGGSSRLATTCQGAHRVDPMASGQVLPEILSP